MNEPSSKPFDRHLHMQFDGKARQIVKEHLCQSSLVRVRCNMDPYGVDLVGDGISVEVEVKHDWEDGVFPFRSLHIPARKAKWAKPNHFFAVLNRPMTMMAWVKGEDLSIVIEKTTKYTENEGFFEVPLHRVSFEHI